MSISPALGDAKTVDLDQGTVHYRETGSGQTIVFVHGLLVNGDLWRKVVPRLSGDFRCIVPDWPLGAHESAMKETADVSPPAVARIIRDFLAALDLSEITLVGHDTGGGICQLLIADDPQRVGRLVLTNCDAYENFLPAIIRPLQWSARLPGFGKTLAYVMRWRPTRWAVFKTLMKSPPEREVSDALTRPLLENAGVRRDTLKFLRGISNRQTLAAAASFAAFTRPVLIAWAPGDRLVFSWKYAQRLKDDFPNARLERIEHSLTFTPEDQPERLAALIADFIRDTDLNLAGA